MNKDTGASAETAAEQGLLEHLYELRDRLLRSVLTVFVVFICLFPFSDTLYTWLAEPLSVHLPAGTSMIATEVASTFFIPFKLTLMTAVFVAVPVLLYQIWAFVAPGLYRHEKRLVFPLLFSSTVLFYLGIAFAYYVVFPLMFGFFISVAPEGVEVATDIGRYLDFVITIFFAFGAAFEVPVATFILVAMGVTTPDALAEKRPFFIVGAFVVGMLLTPPDIISQTLLALPMWLLFELGIIGSRIFLRERIKQAAAEAASGDGADDESTDESARDGSDQSGNVDDMPAKEPVMHKNAVPGMSVTEQIEKAAQHKDS